MKNGVELTLKQLAAVFAKFSLVDVDPLGENSMHIAPAIQVVDSDQPANTVVTVLQEGLPPARPHAATRAGDGCQGCGRLK